MAPLLFNAVYLLLAGTTSSEPALPTLSIDLAPLDRPTFEALERAGVYQGLVLRLVSERVALVDPRERADVVLRMEQGADAREVLVTASSELGSRSRRVSIRDLGQEEARLWLIHASVELVQQIQALSRPASPRETDGPNLRPRLEVGGGVLWNAAKPGILTRLAGGMHVGPGEIGLGFLLHRPLALPADLDLTEWGLFAGAGTGERAVGSRFQWAAGLDLGVWQHRWSWSGTPEDNGSKLDGAALLHGEAALRLGSSWRVGLGAGALFTLRERTHQTSSGVLWKAPQFRPFVGLVAGFGYEAGN